MIVDRFAATEVTAITATPFADLEASDHGQAHTPVVPSSALGDRCTQESAINEPRGAT
jgi:hypothetical protein